MNDSTELEVLKNIEHAVAGMVMEIKSIHTHSASSWYFLQCTAEDLLAGVRTLIEQRK